MTTQTTPELDPLLLAIEAIKLEDVPVFLLERWTPLKQQAIAARGLFKQLGLKGISVTTPHWSMASCVQIRIPRAPSTDALHAEWEEAHRISTGFAQKTPLGILRARRWAIEQHLQAILDKAFPNHHDKSRSEEDYFDACWSID